MDGAYKLLGFPQQRDWTWRGLSSKGENLAVPHAQETAPH